MPIRVDSLRQITHKRRIKNTPLFREEKCLIDRNISYDATNIMQNSHLSFWDKLIFKALDTISPLMEGHRIIKNNIIKVSEKVLKANNDI